MIERTTREAMYKLLENNPTWNVIDLASSASGWKYANVYTDIVDRVDFYKQRYPKDYGKTKKFLQCDVENPPFADKEFDFVVASHILEHVKDPENFLKQIVRIGKQGYIETPTPLFDNLVDGPIDPNNKYGHKWWITFDDGEKSIVYNPKQYLVKKTVQMAENNRMMCFFRDSVITSLYWKDDIKLTKGDLVYTYDDNRDLKMKFDLKIQKVPTWQFGGFK